MRRIGTWLCLVALLVVGAVAATAASAAEELPALGRCVPATGKTGEYKGPYCVKKAPGNGTYNFVAGPGPNPKFEGTIGPTKLETVGGKYVVTCSFGVATGEYTGQKTAKVSLALVGCLNQLAQKCQTLPVKEGEIETQPLEGEFGFIKGGEHAKVGLDLKPAAPIAFSCGLPPELPTAVTVEGSAIGLWTPPNRMRSTFKARYTANGGKQNPEQFEGGVKDTLSLTRVTGVETATEQVGLTIIGVEEIPKALIIENAEPIEIKAL